MSTPAYTDDQIAHALAILSKNGGNVKRSCQELGVEWGKQPGLKTLTRWRDQLGVVEEGQRFGFEVSQKKRLYLTRWSEILLLSLKHLEKHLKEMTPKDMARLAGIATDKLTILMEGRRSQDGYGRGAASANAAASASASVRIEVGSDLMREVRAELNQIQEVVEGEVVAGEREDGEVEDG